jgi:hypothetical protein
MCRDVTHMIARWSPGMIGKTSKFFVLRASVCVVCVVCVVPCSCVSLCVDVIRWISLNYSMVAGNDW